jgi:hypothetical protein
VDQTFRQFLSVARVILKVGLVRTVDREIQQRRQPLWVGDPISKLSLKGDGLKIRGRFREHERNIGARQRDGDDRGRRGPVEERQSGAFALDLAVLALQNVGGCGTFMKRSIGSTSNSVSMTLMLVSIEHYVK